MSSSVKLQPSPSLPQTPPRKSSPQKPSCVLLVCVYDTIIFQLTNQLIYTRFEQFGTIVRILIFERKEVSKLFVEFEKTEEAVKAKEALDGKKLCDNICKMSIYYSNFQNVDLRHQTTEGMEFMNQRASNQEKVSSVLSNKTSSKCEDDFDQFSVFGFNKIPKYGFGQQNGFLPRSKTDVHQIQWHINKIKKQQNSWGGLLYIDQTIKSDIDSILNCQTDQFQNQNQKWSTNQTDQSPKRTLTPKIKTNQYKDENLTVIGFKIKNVLKHSQVYNLFSNFGNISMINIKKNQVRIKFRTVQFAAIAKNYLNNTWLLQNKIQITSYPSPSCLPQQNQYSQLICYDTSTDRFTQKKSITINPPSKVLHVSGLKKQKCTFYEISNMFKHVIQPVKVKILKQNSEKNMALVEFGCLEDSFEVVAECHNMLVGGRKIQISFTKSQI